MCRSTSEAAARTSAVFGTSSSVKYQVSSVKYPDACSHDARRHVAVLRRSSYLPSCLFRACLMLCEDDGIRGLTSCVVTVLAFDRIASHVLPFPPRRDICGHFAMRSCIAILHGCASTRICIFEYLHRPYCRGSLEHQSVNCVSSHALVCCTLGSYRLMSTSSF